MLFALLVLLVFSLNWTIACNEAICASIVSKCMLLNSCKCDLKTCTCCKDCFLCLSFLYDECCSCFDLCPKPNTTDNPLSKKSHVEDFDEPFPELFRALTSEPDEHNRWTVFTYLVDFPMNFIISQEMEMMKYQNLPFDNNRYNYSTSSISDSVTVNCTVTFTTECNSWTKCKQSCQTMGATSYRWFHDGCCECIGDTCINYGISESRCSNCPVKKKAVIEEYDDYGQYDDDYDISDDETYL